MAKKADALAAYNKKRDFSKTAEPKGGYDTLPWGDGNGFIVQKHDATRLHYDFRLEMEGTLKSWAVTRGPSLDPDDKRLSVRTEDHPLSYATFEGTIPKGQYGGGTVMLWDRGTWTPDPRKDPRKTIEEGHLHFTLDGERMKGEWVMFRLKPRGNEKNENWILRKVEDDQAGSSTGLTEKFLTSIKTGRTMNEIAEGKKAKELTTFQKSLKTKVARSPAKGIPAKAGISAKDRTKPSRGPGLRRGNGKPPAFREPQKATLVDNVPSGSAWIHEMKYDGYRCLLGIGGGEAKVYTRSGLDWSDKFPEIVEAARTLDCGSALLDGEIVKLDDQGNTGFSALQQAISEGGRGLSLFLFDALELNGEELASLPNIERKQRLASLLGDGRPPLILYAEHIVGQGEKLFDAMCDAGQEGIISKKADAPYRGARTKAWLKVKCTRRQEFVIVGWLPSEAKARGIRSLLLAVNEGGKLRYAGKVGTGFNMQTLQDLSARFATLEAKKAALEVPRAEARGARWLKPELVAEIAFAEFTADKVVRHASFLGLRSDKTPDDVVEEKPQPLPKAATAPAADAVKISNPDRVIFPDSSVTKGQLADYYRAVGSIMLPWAADRPISLVRCPQGRAKKCFFQKHDAGTFGEHVMQVPILEKNGATEDYIYVADLAGLLTCVQMGTIEFHGWGSRVADVEKPDRIVFDLDPDEGLGFDEVRRAARDLKGFLADMGLQTFPMLTGGKGVHVIVPLTPEAEWPEVRDFAQRFCVALATAEPERFTANLAKARRKGRIFLDYLRNQRGATAVMPYSARARAGAPVAAPITWEELDDYESGARYSVLDSDLLLERASSRALQGWGEAAQTLPDV
ncbi:DNA ligase D [Sphingosinicella sp. LY1275]|uniref:DNA ligase D n=1 Tax=Sphingosinicella sp. LY1275 TaxID=3095379 RepID=UPI002ADEE809|nr:DNA ligase D [Sphingosinicella sp. LY1275]MEA1013852.1 DNA ligase D [Sphingosinicella sp. LY1275]